MGVSSARSWAVRTVRRVERAMPGARRSWGSWRVQVQGGVTVGMEVSDHSGELNGLAFLDAETQLHKCRMCESSDPAEAIPNATPTAFASLLRTLKKDTPRA